MQDLNLNFENMSLEEAQEMHEKNQVAMAKAEDEMKGWADELKEITIKVQKLQQDAEKKLARSVRPLNNKLAKFEVRLQNKNVDMVEMTILKHELEGIIKNKGGSIDDKYKVVLPERAVYTEKNFGDELTLSERIVKEIQDGTMEVSPIIVPEHQKKDAPKIIL